MTGRSSQQGIQSLEIGIDLFRCLHRMGRPATLAELASSAQMHPSKAHRYCVSLIRSGLMRQDGRGLYALGPLAIELSASEASASHLRYAAASVLPLLVTEIGETVFLSIWGRRGPRIIAVEEPAKAILLKPATRGDLPLHSSATGRAFAAFMRPDKVTPLLDGEFADLVAHDRLSKVAIARLRGQTAKHLAETRRRGVARSINERYQGFISFSAPVLDAGGEVAMALTTFGLCATMPSGWDSPAACALKSYAAELAQKMGRDPSTILPQPDILFDAARRQRQLASKLK